MIKAISQSAIKPIRSNLQKTSDMKILAGSSMSNISSARLYETDMVIPNGMDIHEKLYYSATGKLPSSVIDRLTDVKDKIINESDQIITVNKTIDGNLAGIANKNNEALSFCDDLSKTVSDLNDLIHSDLDGSIFDIFI